MNREIIYSQQWSMTANYGNEKAVMSLVVATLEKQLQRVQWLAHVDDVRTVLAEACINGIEYGDGTPIKVSLHIHPHQFELEVINGVNSRQELSQQQASVDQLWQQENPRGWGLLLIRQLCDQMEYGYCQEGFYIRMRFLIKGEKYGAKFACDDETAGQSMDY